MVVERRFSMSEVCGLPWLMDEIALLDRSFLFAIAEYGIGSRYQRNVPDLQAQTGKRLISSSEQGADASG